MYQVEKYQVIELREHRANLIFFYAIPREGVIKEHEQDQREELEPRGTIKCTQKSNRRETERE